ncbi:MAG: nucleotidyltransferase domain-containing protein [Candidatus Jordarchaeales archaeon]
MNEASCEKMAIRLVDFVSKIAGESSVSSVIFFGSVLDGGMSPLSDVDVLIVLKSGDKGIVKKVAAALRGIEKAEPPSPFIEKVLDAVNMKTGMFKSFFVCREEDLRKGDFSSIFSLSRVMSALLAPSKLVLSSAFNGAKVVYGEAELPPPRTPSPLQLVKSLAMNLLLSTAALLIAPFTLGATKYSMEAVKWSTMASYYYVFRKRLPVNKIPLSLKGWMCKHATRFAHLRHNYRKDPYMLALTPLFTLAVHLLALRRGILKA